MPTPRKHKRLWHHQLATKDSTTSSSARKKSASSHQWKARISPKKATRVLKPSQKVPNYIYSIHYLSSRRKKSTSYRPLSLSRKVKEKTTWEAHGNHLTPPREDTGCHLRDAHQQFVPPEPQWFKTSQIINSASQETQTPGICSMYPPYYWIN